MNWNRLFRVYAGGAAVTASALMLMSGDGESRNTSPPWRLLLTVAYFSATWPVQAARLVLLDDVSYD